MVIYQSLIKTSNTLNNSSKNKLARNVLMIKLRNFALLVSFKSNGAFNVIASLLIAVDDRKKCNSDENNRKTNSEELLMFPTNG